MLYLILRGVWVWGNFSGIEETGKSPGRDSSVSVELQVTALQGQEQGACPDKVLGMVWMEDAFVVQMEKTEAQRRTGAFLETQGRVGAQVWTPPPATGAPNKESCSCSGEEYVLN